MSKLVRPAIVWALLVGAFLSLPATGNSQALPSVRRFVDFLDVRCYRIPNQLPINVPLRLDHLNPVLIDQGVPFEDVVLQEAQDLCVPVQKDNLVPPADTLPFIRFVDWKCYGIQGHSLDLPLHLDHLNPVIAQKLGPSDDVIVREPQQLCVPVAKNNAFPPADIRHLIESLDVKCYKVEPKQVASADLRLKHLNPLFAGLPVDNTVLLGPALQLCVPVAKNKQIPPDDVLPYIQFSDVLCYSLRGTPLNQNLTLTHLNPVLIGMGLPPENVFVGDSDKICVPVAKNGKFPPGAP